MKKKTVKKPKSKIKKTINTVKKTNSNIIVPDTSAIIEGLISKKIITNEISPKTILIHEAVLSELEHQANQGRETGYLGIDEIKKLRDLSKKYKFSINYAGKRPEEFEIRHAKSGEIDSLIRHLAFEKNATLITADKVQALVAESKGVKVILIEFEKSEEKEITIEKLFDNKTMSVHIREGMPIYAKKGLPGNWDFEIIIDKVIEYDEIKEIANEIVEKASLVKDGFIEIQRKGSTIVQLRDYRIVITKPSFSDAWEITAVRPIKKTVFKDYTISDKLKQRIISQAEGILIAGSPGMGKSTFAQALAEHYASQQKIVKTVEAPRDLQLSERITQYSMSHGAPEEIHDILLLSRPDHAVFDEMRNTGDFKLFSDLRLAGIGLVGVVHATQPIDAIQRFIGRIELGVIPHVIDTVIFIKNGNIEKTFNVGMEVKVPEGMTEADLARPIVVVRDFETNKLEFELYSYGEETVVIPVAEETKTKDGGAKKLASEAIQRKLMKYSSVMEVDVLSDNSCNVFVPQHDIAGLIGKEGKTINRLEKEIGMKINVKNIEDKDEYNYDVKEKTGKPIPYDIVVKNKFIVFFVDPQYIGKNVDLYVDEDYLISANVGKKADVKVRKSNNLGRTILDAIEQKGKIEIKVD